MAVIGLRYSAFARFQSHTDGNAITYDTGRVIGMDISANIAITRNSNKLYADDVVAEEDNSISAAEITVNLDDLALEDEQYLLGLAKTGDNQTAAYEDTDDAAPLGGYGYVRVRSKTTGGQTKKTYIATWWYKVRARIEAEATTTKGENVSWQTPTIIMSAAGAYVDKSDKLKFRKRQEFATYAEAKAFIDGFANITSD